MHRILGQGDVRMRKGPAVSDLYSIVPWDWNRSEEGSEHSKVKLRGARAMEGHSSQARDLNFISISVMGCPKGRVYVETTHFFSFSTKDPI